MAAATPVSSRWTGAISSRPGALDLGGEHVGQFDFGRGGASPGNMNAKLGEPVELESEALWKVRREQSRRDRDDEEAGAGRAIARDERGRVERPVRACKPRSHDLDHERDVGAARAAESEKRATESRLRIGGWLSIGVDRPARGQRLASFRIVSELDKGGRAGRLVDQQRRPSSSGAAKAIGFVQ